jgi:hypothetical protein
MTRCLIMAITMMATGLAVAMAAPSRTYVNAKFGFSVSYPGSLVLDPPPFDGDGRVFRLRSGGDGQIIASAIYNVGEETPAEVADEAVTRGCQGSPVGYRVVRAPLVAMSCVHGDEVFYEKTLIHGDILMSVSATYPRSEAATWEPIVRQMAGSLRPSH